MDHAWIWQAYMMGTKTKHNELCDNFEGGINNARGSKMQGMK